MKLQVCHLTHYTYQEAVAESVNEIRLTPRTDDRQTCHSHSITIEPEVSLFQYEDYFGNTAHYFSVPFPHSQLSIKSCSIMETDEEENPETNRIPYAVEREILHEEKFQNEYAEYLIETDYTRISAELKHFKNITIDEDQAGSIYQLLEAISHAIHTNFTYDANATQVSTTVEETLRLKRGVCQDYVHLMIALCRMLHIPARYVSGYQFLGDLNADDPIFQHASHAWVEAYVPLIGWLGFDPTSNGKINWRYVTLGKGRDYSDIVPVKGIYQGTNIQRLEVVVDIERIDDSRA